MTQLKQYTEKLTPNSGDWLLIQDTNTGLTQKIQKQNLVTQQTTGTKLQIIQLSDIRPQNTFGGNATVGAWTSRVLNTIAHDDTSAVTLTNNIFSLPSGSYFIDGLFQFYRTASTSLRLRNTTDNTVLLSGLNSYPGLNNDMAFGVPISGWFSIPSAKSFAVEYKVSSNNQTIGSLGLSNNYGPEVYAILNIYKVN